MKSFKTTTDLNLAIKIASISIDAIKTYYEIDEKEIKSSNFKGRVITSNNTVWNLLSGFLGDKTSNFLKGSLSIGKALALLSILYSGGKRMATFVTDLINKDPQKIQSLPDPYEYIKRGEDVEYPGNKFKNKHKPDKSRVVGKDFYSDLNRDENWYSDLENKKVKENLNQSGVPAQFGISPGFSVDNRRIKDEAFYDSMRKYNCSERLLKSFAQSAGSFKSETIDKIQGPQLSPNSANWINVNSWEQFLSQDPEGKWAATPSPDSSFYDPSRTLGRNEAMRWDPAGYGQDFYSEKIGDRLNVAKERLEQFNEPEAERQSAKIIFLNRQVNLREKTGNITPNQAAQLRHMLVLLQKQNNPEVASKIENLVRSAISGGFYTMPGQIDYSGIPEEQIDWETIENPMDSNEEYQKVLDRSLGLVDKYKENDRYQNILEDSEYLS